MAFCLVKMPMQHEVSILKVFIIINHLRLLQTTLLVVFHYFFIHVFEDISTVTDALNQEMKRFTFRNQ